MWPVCRGARQAPRSAPGPAAAPGSPITRMCPGWSWHGPHSGWPVPCGHCLIPWPRLMGASCLGHERLGPGPRPPRAWGAPALTARCSSGARPRLCPAAPGSQVSIRFASSPSSGPQLSPELTRGLTCSPAGVGRWEDQHTAAVAATGLALWPGSLGLTIFPLPQEPRVRWCWPRVPPAPAGTAASAGRPRTTRASPVCARPAGRVRPLLPQPRPISTEPRRAASGFGRIREGGRELSSLEMSRGSEPPAGGLS